MDCINHTGITATAYCQSCGRALCAGCVRQAATGQILCEPCWITWQNYQFGAPQPGGPYPGLAAFLGLFPGVGAMYNGQFIKGFVHVAVFIVLVSIAGRYGAFGILIAAWIIYQSLEAYHTAKALRDDLPLPDPLGLNEAGYWFNPGSRPRPSSRPGAPPDPEIAAENPPPPGPQPPPAAQHQVPYRQPPFTPPICPLPPICWRRREPIGALLLIALGTLFLLDKFDIFNGHLFNYAWPILLIVLGIWLIVRRLTDSPGGLK